MNVDDVGVFNSLQTPGNGIFLVGAAQTCLLPKLKDSKD